MMAVLEPGKPSSMHHAESGQEDVLVLLHCPAGTCHTLVGAGDQRCVIFMTGARREDDHLPAFGHGRALDAGVETETDMPSQAYAPFASGRLGGMESGPILSWTY